MKTSHWYNFTIIDISEGGEIGYAAIIPKFPKLHIVADSPEELSKVVPQMIEEEIRYYKEKQKKVPLPDIPEKKGNFTLRLSPALRERVSELASAEGISLNGFVEKAVREKVGA